MDKHIFYSWQSDLPNSKNRGFIQKCIELAIAEIQRKRLHLEVVLDRDTKGVSGTPDIVSTIFSKIEKTNIFIADVSLINSTSTDRKTPNPNVLVELGYAAKAIGWDNIICIFNSEFGCIEDLPFDLRFRRPIIYQIQNTANKSQDKKFLADRIKAEISAIINKQSAKDEIRNYLKESIDKEVLAICNQLSKIVNGYDEPLTSENIWTLLAITRKELEEKLEDREFLGFTVLKDWEGHLDVLEKTINQPFFVQHAEEVFTGAALKIVKALEMIVYITKQGKVFVDTDRTATGLKLVHGPEMNEDNPKDHYLLLKELPEEKGIVIDFGTIRPFNTKRLLVYQRLGVKFPNFIGITHMLLLALNNWTKNTGNRFMIGPSAA